MLKQTLQILIIAFILILCYDTIDIYVNRLNSKKEHEIIIVKRDIEGTTRLLNKSTPYETYYFSIWPAALGFTSALCYVLYRYLTPFKKELKVSHLVLTASKNDTAKEINHDIKEESRAKVHLKNQDVKSENDTHSDTIADNDFVTANNSEVMNRLMINSRERESCGKNIPNNLKNIRDNTVTDREKAGQKSFSQNLANSEILTSTLKLFDNDDLSASACSLLPMDCSNSKNLCDMLLENRNIGKVGLPVPRSLYTEENRIGKHYSLKKLNDNSEIFGVRNKFIGEETNLRSDDSLFEEMTIFSNQEHIMGLISNYNSCTEQVSKKSCEKSTSAHILTVFENDVKSFEKRLEAVEHGLKRSDDKTKDWGRRINVAETELVDLHEQMYTIFSKLEEEKKPNYIIVSQVSKDTERKKHKGHKKEIVISDVESVTDDAKHQIIAEKEGSENKQNLYDADAQEELNSRAGTAENEVLDKNEFYDDNSNLQIPEVKSKSLALDAMLEKELNSYNQRRSQSPRVPPHIIPPYKRTTFTRTDSKSDLSKRKKYKTPPIFNDIMRGRIRS